MWSLVTFQKHLEMYFTWSCHALTMRFQCTQHVLHFLAMYFTCCQNEADVLKIWPLATMQEHFREHFQVFLKCGQRPHVGQMRRLHFKCNWNVIGGNMLGKWHDYILNVPKMWLVVTLWGNCSRELNVLNMWSLISIGPRPQWEKEDAVTARVSSTTFTTDEERLQVMQRFDE